MTDSVSGLNSQFVSLINSIMTNERAPLTTMTTQRDTINTQISTFNSVNAKLNDLQSAIKGLISTDPFTQMILGKSLTVSPFTPNTTVATATASSKAVAGDYNLVVNNLATAERFVSKTFSSVDQALSLQGKLLLGGNGINSSASVGVSDVVGAVTTSNVASGLHELGTGTYSVETRTTDGIVQFRLKDADGNVVPVADKNATDNSLTTNWQNMSAGTFDTKRGLTLTLNNVAGQAAAVSYTAKGVSISVGVNDSLTDIANNINNSLQPTGHDMVASVVGKQIVFTSANTGDNHTMLYTDNVGFGLVQNQEAKAAQFQVNGIDLSRQSNTNLTDVIAGVTFNLASDAETAKQATIQVKSDISGINTAINTFITKLNDINDYIDQQSAVTKNDDNTYTRGALANDNIFSSLRSSVISELIGDHSNSGSLRYLSQIGIGFDNNLHITITDQDKLNAALTNNFDDVKSLLSSVMGNVNQMVGNYTGNDGYVTQSVNAYNSQVSDLSSQINDFNLAMIERQNALYDQYGQIQATLYSLSYDQQAWQGIYGSTNKSY